jgi:hypothetical protein
VAVAYALAMFERIGVHDCHFNEATVRSRAGVLLRGIAPADQRNP